MSLQIVRTVREEQWRSFVHEHPQGNIFHTPEMFEVFSRAKGHRPELWAAVDDGGHIWGLLLPVKLALLAGFRRRFTTRSVAYGGVLCVPGREGQTALAQLLQTYTREFEGAPLFTELRNLSDMEHLRAILEQHGFVHEDHLNYLIDLNRSSEAMMQAIGPRTRKNIRRGLKRGEVVIAEAKDRGQVAECYALLRQTYRRARVPLADSSLFEGVFDVLHRKGMARLTLAQVGGSPAAASVELLYKDVIYGWYGGVDRDYASHLPNELLMWSILQWGAENGYRVYDFGGAGKPDEEYGVRDFKAKFGGELVCYGRNTCVHAPFRLALSKLGYEGHRRLGSLVARLSRA